MEKKKRKTWGEVKGHGAPAIASREGFDFYVALSNSYYGHDKG